MVFGPMSRVLVAVSKTIEEQMTSSFVDWFWDALNGLQPMLADVVSPAGTFVFFLFFSFGNLR